MNPQALDGMLWPVAGSVGNWSHVPNRYTVQPQGPMYVLSDQTLLPGLSPFFAAAPGGFERAFMFASGLLVQPVKSHDGQPEKE